MLVAIDGIQATPDNFEQLVCKVEADSSVVVHIFRRDELMQFAVKPQTAPPDTCDLWLIDGLEAEQLNRRNSWLASSDVLK